MTLKRSWLRLGFVLSAAVAACEFSHGELPRAPGDGGPDAPPDAGACAAASSECVGDLKRDCAGPGATATDTECTWGCSTTPAVHCLQLQPSGNGGNPGSGAAPADLVADPALVDVTLAAGIVIDSDSGKIGTFAMPELMRGSGGVGIINGIDYQRRGPVSVFRFKSLTVNGDVSLIGTKAIALVADGAVTINSVIDARGPCTTTIAGPGGGAGGAKQGGDAAGSGAGAGINSNNIGGGGGGHGSAGGDGGNGANGAAPGGAGGTAFGLPEIAKLVGGGGGAGGGGGTNSGSGGGGGGAVQVLSNRKIEIAANGGINAGGCGGQTGSAGNDAGGGGGAGGAILLEAPAFVLAGALAVNGGGGGGGNASNLGRASAGSLSRTPAAGATGNADGGDGAAGAVLVGGTGSNANSKAGGGGGGIGRIRINTRNNAGTTVDTTSAVLSPSFDDPGTTCTKGSASVQ